MIVHFSWIQDPRPSCRGRSWISKKTRNTYSINNQNFRMSQLNQLKFGRILNHTPKFRIINIHYYARVTLKTYLHVKRIGHKFLKWPEHNNPYKECFVESIWSIYSEFWSLRVWWFLIWHILDKILAKQGFKDIIQISQFVELAFILRKTCVKIF
jgi:hypothetical protein